VPDYPDRAAFRDKYSIRTGGSKVAMSQRRDIGKGRPRQYTYTIETLKTSSVYLQGPLSVVQILDCFVVIHVITHTIETKSNSLPSQNRQRQRVYINQNFKRMRIIPNAFERELVPIYIISYFQTPIEMFRSERLGNFSSLKPDTMPNAR
jgi:hypothetical protein